MRRTPGSSWLVAVAVWSVSAATAAEIDTTPTDQELADLVPQLVLDLGADSEATRRDAREILLEFAGPTALAAERVLAALPEPVEQMPPAVRKSLAEIRKIIAARVAELAVSASRVSLDVVQEPLSEVLASIEAQTGNRVKDLRSRFGQQAIDRPVTLGVRDAPFWEALDQVLDEAGLGVYTQSGEQALALVAREPGAAARWSAADYAGPLRIEPIRVTASRNLRQVSGESLSVQLEVSWEPRLTPIAFAQPLADVVAENEDGARLSMARPERTIRLEAPSGGQAVEMTLPMLLPTRDTSLIATLRGKLQAIVPGRRAEFRFEGLDESKTPVVQQQGDATVTLSDLRRNGEVWEVHMRLRLGGAEGEEGRGADNAFASHRGWVFENLTHLEDAAGVRIEHAGYETTMQRGNEIGLAYLFDLPAGVEGLTWVYQTPTAITRFPVEYELRDIALP